MMESGYKKQKGLNRMINLVAGNYVGGHLLYRPPVFTGEKIEAQEAVICPRLPPPTNGSVGHYCQFHTIPA